MNKALISSLFNYTSSDYFLSGVTDCFYSLANSWGSPIGRITEYLDPFTVDSYKFKSITDGQLLSSKLIGFHSRSGLLKETLPFTRLKRSMIFKLIFDSLIKKPSYLDGNICCLLDHNNWHNSYFHWFFDILPRALASSYFSNMSGEKVRLLVPNVMFDWQVATLCMLDFKSSDLIFLDSRLLSSGIVAEYLLAAPSARVQGLGNAPFDCMSPGIIQLLADRLNTCNTSFYTKSNSPTKVFISRKLAYSRRIINEDNLEDILSQNGYSLVCLESMCFEEQKQIFSCASHIIGVHGGGLTNLLFAKENTIVLEVFAQGHGIRPDYFQLASIMSLTYHHLVLPSVNKFNDIYLQASILKRFFSFTT